MAVGYNPRTVTDGLVLSLDAGNPKNYNAGISTNWTDKVGGNNGTLVGGTYHNDGPFVGAGYVEFDGSGDYLTISDNTDFNFGNGDWTIEGWAYVSSINTYMAFGPTNYSTTFDYIVYDSGGQISFAWYPYSSSTGFITSASTYPLNSWFHWAVTRSGNTFRIFIDGSLDATGTNSSSLSHAANAVTIGRQTGIPARDFSGYQSNIRVVKGTALYTSDFTPPTGPLTAVPNTVLLTCQGNTIADASSSAHSISVTGNAAANLGFPKSAFVFDGTDDYVGAPVFIPTEDASIEVWARIDIFEGNVLFGFGGDDYPGGLAGSGPDVYISSGTWAWNTGDGVTNAFSANPTVNTTDWFHYVVTTESASNAKLYVNGILIGTANHKSAQVTNSGDRVIIGRWANTTGYETPGNYGIVRVYNRVLSLSEIQQNYNATKGRYA
jgi:hypothetical protein